MKVIFLDFDGVINNQSSIFLRTLQMIYLTKESFSLASPNPVSVSLIELLVRASNAKIVISSSWRIGMTVHELRRCLADDFGMTSIYTAEDEPDPIVIDKTRPPEVLELRGQQIDDWLKTHPEVTEYVIIDDDSDMLEHHKNHFVKTSFDVGFDYVAFDKALKILKVSHPIYDNKNV